MEVLITVLCVFTIASAASTIILRRKGRSFDGMLFKFLSSFGFMSIAFVGFCFNSDCDPVYFCLVLFGLMFGLAGDILLGLKEIAPRFRMRLIGMGTGAFLIGHIFFLAAFLRFVPFSPVPLIIALVIGVASFGLIKAKFKVDLKMALVLTVYYTLLWYKAVLAAFIYWQTRNPAFIAAAVGCALFVFSDTCLGFLYFTPTKSKNKLVTLELGSYYDAQILLAVTVALLV